MRMTHRKKNRVEEPEKAGGGKNERHNTTTAEGRIPIKRLQQTLRRRKTITPYKSNQKVIKGLRHNKKRKGGGAGKAGQAER